MAEGELLTAFWVETPTSATRGFGVTAYSVDDAFSLLTRAGLEVDRATVRVVERVRVADLDQDHVVPNMGPIVRRGVWYPNLNS